MQVLATSGEVCTRIWLRGYRLQLGSDRHHSRRRTDLPHLGLDGLPSMTAPASPMTAAVTARSSASTMSIRS